MYKYIALTALALGSAALGFNINRGGEEQFTVGLVEDHGVCNVEFAHTGKSFIFDLDLDGFDDMVRVAVAGGPSPYVDLRAKMNQGDMSFSSWESIGAYDIDPLPDLSGQFSDMRVWHAHLMNVNGDPYPDLVFQVEEDYKDFKEGVYGCNVVTVYLINNGSGNFACAGDINNDGETDVTDLLGVIGDWGCTDQGLPD